MSKIFFTSDWHLGHDKEFIWKERGFSSVWEMNEEIVKRHNSVVSPEDEVYVLGDLMMGDSEAGIKLFKQMKGNFHIICGNHDTNNRINLYNDCFHVKEIFSVGEKIKIGKKEIYLTHHPLIVANGDNPHVPLNFYGHTHQTDNFYDKTLNNYHVGVDSHNCYPVEIQDILSEIKEAKDKKEKI